MNGKRQSYLSVVPTTASDKNGAFTQLPLFSKSPTQLFFLIISRQSHLFFKEFLEKSRPVWILDFRPVPWFNFGNYSRKSVFYLFEENKITYRDAYSSLNLANRRDSRIASGEVADMLNDLLPKGYSGPIACLWDDRRLMETAAKVLPEKLSIITKKEWKATISDPSNPMCSRDSESPPELTCRT